MKSLNKKIVILKIGGSVITQKNRKGTYVRRKLLFQIADELHEVLKKNKDLQLIIIHGAGSSGHQLAKKYKLATGVRNDQKKWKGSLLTRIANQELNLEITKIFSEQGLRVTPVHTASVVIQKDGDIDICERGVLDESLRNDCIPLLYGEMVFDTDLGMSVCSGDASAVYLADMFNAERILYASDVDGVFDKDPYIHSDAKFIKTISLKNICSNKKIILSQSHHVDVTGGIQNKIVSLYKNGLPEDLKQVIIFNGLKKNAFKRALLDKNEGTVIGV